MASSVTCQCGHVVEFSFHAAKFCAVCGQLVEPPAVEPAVKPEEKSPDSSGTWVASQVLADDPEPPKEPPLWLRLLLDPRSIQRLLLLGGGLGILGLIAWLISLGVFEDPRALAAALGTATLGLFVSGWWVALRTGHRVAGQSLAFLACVVAPLNLWFYDAQRLLTVDGHLWVAGLGCSLLYFVTLLLLRDPKFLYAVEVGVTLTVILLLGTWQHATDSAAIGIALTLLAALSIHAEAAFDPQHPVFDRKRYGLPLFFSGQAQLAVGMLSLLVLQGLNWAFAPHTEAWGYSRLASNPWLAATLWLAAAYLWFYSDLVVRKIGLYTYLAALALVLAEVTLVNHLVNVDGLMVVLAVTAIAVQTLTRSLRQSESRWSAFTLGAGTLVSVLPFGIGLVRHVQFAGLVGPEAATIPFGFTAALVVVAVCLGLEGALSHARSSLSRFALHTAAGLCAWMVVTHVMWLAGWTAFSQFVPVLLVGSIAAIVVLRATVSATNANHDIACVYAITLAGLLLSAMTHDATNDIARLLTSGPRTSDAAIACLLFVELAVIFFVGSTRLASRTAGGLFAVLAVWKGLVYVDLPEVWIAPLTASVGLSLLIAHRLRTLTLDGSEEAVAATSARTTGSGSRSVTPTTPSAPSALQAAGDIGLALGELIGFFQALPLVLDGRALPPATSLIAVLLTAILSGVGALVATSRSVRGWHGFAATVIAFVTGAAFIRYVQLKDYQKLELALEMLGLTVLTFGWIGRLRETKGERDAGVGLALWLGSACATIPVFVCTVLHRFSTTGPSLGDELGLITVCVLMIAIGCVLQVRSSTSLGGAVLGLYLAILFAHLAYHPQVAIGIYLAVGGGLIFLVGVILSIFRDRLLALPSKISNREGVFQVLDWR